MAIAGNPCPHTRVRARLNVVCASGLTGLWLWLCGDTGAGLPAFAASPSLSWCSPSPSIPSSSSPSSRMTPSSGARSKSSSSARRTAWCPCSASLASARRVCAARTRCRRAALTVAMLNYNKWNTHLELTIAALLGRRRAARAGGEMRGSVTPRTNRRTKKRPLSVSLRILSTALCVARRSAVLARRAARRFGAVATVPVVPFAAPVLVAAVGEAAVGEAASILAGASAEAGAGTTGLTSAAVVVVVAVVIAIVYVFLSSRKRCR
ncbi:hypothetical protein C8R45DRAFT_1028467 [Mycena sanguinolenta]|nr:hypothetical protein C8R45DRAFT_1028467 [Mycena sanguinolenta]